MALGSLNKAVFSEGPGQEREEVLSDKPRLGFPLNVMWSNDLSIWPSVSYFKTNIFSPSSMPFRYSITIEFNYLLLIIQLEMTTGS
jgi:hypothetical protein